MYHFHAAASVLRRPVISCYPDSPILVNEKPFISRRMEGILENLRARPVLLQWTSANTLSVGFNHIVPLLKYV